jgi:hypothetical protein
MNPPPFELPEPAASVYTMEALVPGGREVRHVSLHDASLKRGDALYTADQIRAAIDENNAWWRQHIDAAWRESFGEPD